MLQYYDCFRFLLLIVFPPKLCICERNEKWNSEENENIGNVIEKVHRPKQKQANIELA